MPSPLLLLLSDTACPYHASANFVTTRGRRGVRLAVNVERKSGGTGLATDDTDATDIHRLPCASVICANRCYLCPLWANLHVYVCCLGKLYYLCPEFRRHSGGVRKDFTEKVLLKLSSDVKFSQSLNRDEDDSNGTTSLVCTATIGSLHNLWCGLLLYPSQRQCEKPDIRIKQI